MVIAAYPVTADTDTHRVGGTKGALAGHRGAPRYSPPLHPWETVSGMPCRTPGGVLVEVDRLVTKVSTPYDPAFVALVKTQVPGRRWSPTGRFWYAPTSATPSLKDVAVAYFGYPVVE